MAVSMDASGLDRLIADITGATRTTPRKVGQAVEVSARNLRDMARENASGIGHAPYYPRSITYDLERRGFRYEAEIGPDKGRTQGALGNILEYGTSNNAPIAHLGPALDREGPAYVDAIDRVLRGLL